MNDDFIFGYAVGSSGGDNDNGFAIGFAIAIFIFVYPYLPFAIIGYEIGNWIGGGLNIAKWGGTLFGLGFGAWWYFVPYTDFLYKYFRIERGIRFWLLAYLLASLMFLVISLTTDNELAKGIVKMWIAFFKWAISVS